MRREYPEAPLVGVGAIVVNDHHEVLLIRRGQEPNKGAWSLPGGLIELGESVADAVRREVAEETSLEVEVGAVVDVFQPIVRDEQNRIRFHYVVVDYIAFARGGTLQHNSDATDARWVAPAEMDAYNLRAETRAVIEKAWQMLAAAR